LLRTEDARLERASGALPVERRVSQPVSASDELRLLASRAYPVSVVGWSAGLVFRYMPSNTKFPPPTTITLLTPATHLVPCSYSGSSQCGFCFLAFIGKLTFPLLASRSTRLGTTAGLVRKEYAANSAQHNRVCTNMKRNTRYGTFNPQGLDSLNRRVAKEPRADARGFMTLF
jgi:hypothetical protein